MTRLPTICLDADIESADWTKQTWDLPPYKSSEFLALFPDLDAFRQLPVYRRAIENGLIHDDEWVADWVTAQADSIRDILSQAKLLAQRYRALTGKPLGITGEVAEYEAARLLGVTLAPARQAGFDATEQQGEHLRQLQIKARCILPGSKASQRVGSIDIAKPFDAVLLVLLDQNFDAIAIYEAQRDAVIKAIQEPGSKARNERGALSVSKFISIGSPRWER